MRATELGHRLFRNNVGQAWVGKLRSSRNGTAVLDHARPFHGGLAKGSSDLIGWTVVEVTPAMVGTKVAVFTSIEAKTPGVPTTPEQAAWVNKVLSDGGIARVVWNVGEYDAIVAAWTRKIPEP